MKVHEWQITLEQCYQVNLQNRLRTLEEDGWEIYALYPPNGEKPGYINGAGALDWCIVSRRLVAAEEG